MVKLILTGFLALLLAASGFGQTRRSSSGTVKVKGHVTKSGAYVPPHRRTKADERFSNNWSTKGNVNPYTGKAGSRVSPPKKKGNGPGSGQYDPFRG